VRKLIGWISSTNLLSPYSSFLIALQGRPGGHHVSWSRCFPSRRTVSWRGISRVAPLRDRLVAYLGPPLPVPPGGCDAEPMPMNASTAPTAAAITATVANALLLREKRRWRISATSIRGNRNLLSSPERFDAVALPYNLDRERVRAVGHRHQTAFHRSNTHAEQSTEVGGAIICKRHRHVRPARHGCGRHRFVSVTAREDGCEKQRR
jgi:hypothetical protein